MGNNGRVVMGQGNSLENEGVSSNVATVTAQNEKLDSLNVDGQFIRPDWVAARGLSLGESLRVGSGVALTDGCVTARYIGSDAVTTEKIYAGAVTATEISVSSLASISANLGTCTAGTLVVGSGGITITSNAAGGEPTAAGLFLGYASSAPQIYLKDAGGNVTVQLDGSDGSAYFAGEVSASKVTIANNAANSVDFGADVVINGNIVMQDAAGSKYIYLDKNSGNAKVYFEVEDSTHHNLGIQYDSTTIYPSIGIAAKRSGTGCVVGVTWEDMTLTIPAAAASVFSLKEGSTTVMSFAGNSTAVTFAGNVGVSNLTATDVHVSSVTLEGGSVDPTIKPGSAPSEGDTSTEPLGSLRLSTGGSLWLTYLDGSTNKWTKVK